jgi:hypothetical protein
MNDDDRIIEKLAWVKDFVLQLAFVDKDLVPAYKIVPGKDLLSALLVLRHKTGRWDQKVMRRIVREAIEEQDLYAKRIDVEGRVLKAKVMLTNLKPTGVEVQRVVPTHERVRRGAPRGRR